MTIQGYKVANDIIELYLKPRLNSECERLSIPASFIAGIYTFYPRPFRTSSFCEPVIENGNVLKVTIGIDPSLVNTQIALRHLWHELWHAKEFYKGKPRSEWKTRLYVFKIVLSCDLRFVPKTQNEINSKLY